MPAVPGFALRLPPAVIFGSGSLAQLPQEAAFRGARPLVVIGGGSMRRLGLLDRVLDALGAEGLEPAVFEGVEPDPSLETVEKGRAAFRESDCDLVIALGGGSVLDVGKAIGALAHTDEPLATFFAGEECPAAGAPIIALPTTSGTGAEVTPNSVLSDHDQRCKASIRGRSLLPAVALVDPELTLDLPPDQTAYTGLDAFTQGLESYISTGASPPTDALALEAIRRLGGAIRHAARDPRGGRMGYRVARASQPASNGPPSGPPDSPTTSDLPAREDMAPCRSGFNRDPQDLPAREDMALGSLLAGIALASARLGLVHGLAHPLGELYHIPHGFICGLLLPYAVQYNIEAARTKFDHAAAELGLEGGAEGLIAWTIQLCRDLGVAQPLAERGLCRADYPTIIAATMSSGSTKHNPRPPTEADIAALLDQAHAGEIYERIVS